VAFSLPPVSLVPGRNSPSLFFSKSKINDIVTNRRSSQLFGGKYDDDAAKVLQEKAAALRREVEVFEASKQQEKDDLRLRYSAVVPILKGDGTIELERCDFPPRMTKIPDGDDETADNPGPLSRIIAFQAPLPLGIVLGQDEELPMAQRPTTIDAIAEGGNGKKAGVKVGDCLRACTACQMTMEQPTWQLLAGGIGRPKTTRMMFGTDNKSFEEVMDAIVSNQMDPESQDVWLVVERMDDEEEDEDEDEDKPQGGETKSNDE